MRATTLSTIVISLLATIANCEINQPLNETGLDPSNTKYNAFNPEWPDSNNFKVAIYNYQTTYWVFHYQNGTDDYIGQRWGCNTQSLCQWYVHKDTAVLGRYRRFQNVATGYCLRVGDGTLNCANANAIPNNTPITPATCKSYAEDNCQYFSQGGHYISSNQYNYYSIESKIGGNTCVSGYTSVDQNWKLFMYTCANNYNNQWWFFECRGGC